MTDRTQLLTGKIALITGGAYGSGAAISRLFVAQGATVFITDMLATEGHQLAQELGKRASYIYLDPADAGGWQVVIDAIMDDHGGLDIFVYNASTMHSASTESSTIENTSIEDYMSMVNIRQVGNFLGIRSVLPLMKNRSDASIINISSPNAAGTATYPSSKWSIRELSRTAANELRQYAIRVNSVYPTGTANPQPGGDKKNTSNQRCEKTALKQSGATTEVANTVLFLASELCGHSTAGEYFLDGSIINQYGIPSSNAASG